MKIFFFRGWCSSTVDFFPIEAAVTCLLIGRLRPTRRSTSSLIKQSPMIDGTSRYGVRRKNFSKKTNAAFSSRYLYQDIRMNTYTHYIHVRLLVRTLIYMHTYIRSWYALIGDDLHSIRCIGARLTHENLKLLYRLHNELR